MSMIFKFELQPLILAPSLNGIQVEQVYDACGGGTKDFSVLEATQAEQFNSKPRTTQLTMKRNDM